jgi:hypothetical protein
LKFCKCRWLENSCVAERALKIWSNIKKYVECCQSRSNIGLFQSSESTVTLNIPKSVAFQTIKQACNDSLFLAKLTFFKTLNDEFIPFLLQYQTDSPLMPFLAEDWHKLLLSLMNRFLLRDVLSTCHSPAKLGKLDVLSKSNQRELKDIDIGFATKQLLNTSGVSERQKMEFRVDCRLFLQNAVSKLLERSPIHYSIVRNARCLSPLVMSGNINDASRNMRSLLQCLLKARRLQPEVCDQAARQYEQFCQIVVADNILAFRGFSSQTQRVDTFLASYLLKDENYIHFFAVVKMICCLFVGQGAVERGFSINKELLSDNMREKSLVAQRQVQDAVSAVGGVLNVSITKPLLAAVRSSRNKYRMELEAAKQNEIQSKIGNVSVVVH